METKVVFEQNDGRTIEIATGKLAGLADGSCTVRMGDTIVLVTACGGSAREGADFFPLQVDYREKFSAGDRSLTWLILVRTKNKAFVSDSNEERSQCSYRPGF